MRIKYAKPDTMIDRACPLCEWRTRSPAILVCETCLEKWWKGARDGEKLVDHIAEVLLERAIEEAPET